MLTRYERIPQELKALNQWVCVFKNSKCPMKAWVGEAASSTFPPSWATFEQAETSVRDDHYDDIGFVFADNGYVGVDIDAGYDADGFLSSLAADIIGTCQSYTERSRSGRGFHIILKGKLPFKGKNNFKGVEIYKSSRYFIMTGDVILYDRIIDNQLAIDTILEKYFSDLTRDIKDGERGNKVYKPIWHQEKTNRIKLRPIYPMITTGSRNLCLTSLAGMLHNQGYSPAHIYDELLYCNKVACEPMLDREEIKSIVSSVTRYKR